MLFVYIYVRFDLYSTCDANKLNYNFLQLCFLSMNTKGGDKSKIMGILLVVSWKFL